MEKYSPVPPHPWHYPFYQLGMNVAPGASPMESRPPFEPSSFQALDNSPGETQNEQSHGHACGKKDAHSHAAPDTGPVNHPYLHEQIQAGATGMFPGMGAPQGMYYQYTPASQNPGTFIGMDVKDARFWTGALVGTGLVLFLTNDSVQKGLMKAAAGLFSAAQSGVEELKEKFEDVQAELKLNKHEK